MSASGPRPPRSASAHRSTSSASTSWRSISLITAGAGPAAPPARSPPRWRSGRLFARADQRPDLRQQQRAAARRVRNASCSARVARRVGSSKVMSASCSGPGRAPAGHRQIAGQQRLGQRRQERPARRHRVDAPRRPHRRRPFVFLSASKNSAQAPLRFRQRVRRADMHPHAIHAHAVGAARRDRPAPHQVEREGAVRARRRTGADAPPTRR